MDIKYNDRTLIGKELDIYIPDKSIAIECNGLYWHSEIFKPSNYHLDKTNLCKEKGIRLIHIFEDEWINKRKIVEKKLEYILNKTSDIKRIYARKCYIKPIKSKLKNRFLNKYHIQGEDKSCINLGLFYERKLISVMTFCKPRRTLGLKNSKYDYELSRFASTYNYIVVGAFSKLFKYFEKNYEWNTIITYADKRWSNGEVYLKNGWIHDHDSKPNYWYTDGNKRYHRYNFRKSNLNKLFPDIYSDDKTEKEIMKEAGYYRIYDCGNMVFIYERK